MGVHLDLLVNSRGPLISLALWRLAALGLVKRFELSMYCGLRVTFP